MSLLFFQYWDVIQGKEAEHSRYIIDTYLPEITTLGFVPVGGYYVEVGFGPRIIVAFSSESLDDISRIITGKGFKDLTLVLKRYVANFKNLVLEPDGTVKLGRYPIQKGVWKYNQYYDIRPEMKNEYEHFIINEYLPAMEKIDYGKVTNCWNIVLGGFCEIVLESTFKDPEDIGRLMRNQEFHRVTNRLKREFVTNYTNRILRSTKLFSEPRWFKG